MDLLGHLPFIIWWLFILGLTTFGVMMIGLALITWAVEREDSKK